MKARNGVTLEIVEIDQRTTQMGMGVSYIVNAPGFSEDFDANLGAAEKAYTEHVEKNAHI